MQSDSLSKGMEIAGTTLVVFLLGLLLDTRLGSTPWLTVSFVVLALVAQFLRMYYQYNAEMVRHEARRREAARPR